MKHMSRVAARSGMFYGMLAFGLLSLVTGFILYLWPHEQRAGRLIFAGVNKTVWSELHTYISVLAVILILLHLLENRRGVSVYVKTTLGKA
jgi:predicted ferric reductase